MENISEVKCNTCGIKVVSSDSWVEFDCPACGEDKIARCSKCRTIESNYTCKKCGFQGP